MASIWKPFDLKPRNGQKKKMKTENKSENNPKKISYISSLNATLYTLPSKHPHQQDKTT